MPIRQLEVSGVRNLAPLTFAPDPSVNFIYGDNGAGKTSLLEAITLLSSGKSFRTHQFKYLVADASDRLELKAELDDGTQAYNLRFKSGDQLVRLNDKLVSSRAEVVSRMPVQVIDPGSFRLLSGSPEDRRQFLDWGVFYQVESYFERWRQYRQLLKQRNSALKSADEPMVAVWQPAFVEVAELIDTHRAAYFEGLAQEFYRILALLDSGIEGVELGYFRGWDKSLSLTEALAKASDRDYSLGYSQRGPHRAELRVTQDKSPAVEILSRGQQKTVVAALKLAQGHCYRQSTGRAPIYLVDDLASELDRDHRLSLCRLLEQLECQVFITSIDKDQLFDIWTPRAFKLFHVEQGVVEEVGQ